MRKYIKIVVFIFMLQYALMHSAGTLYASDKSVNSNKTDGILEEFVNDKSYAEAIYKKESLAEEYYSAKTNGNTELAKNLLAEFNAKYSSVSGFAQINALEKKLGSIKTQEANVLPLVHFPQEKDIYCGPATAQIILRGEGIAALQETLAGMDYTKCTKFDGTPWHLSHGSDKSQFPMSTTLTKLSGFNYVPSPYGDAGRYPNDAEGLKRRIVSTIDSGHGVAANGFSGGNSGICFPGYPEREVHHWVAVIGYMDYGNIIIVSDPASSDKVDWGGGVSEYYSVTIENLAKFVKSRGIIW